MMAVAVVVLLISTVTATAFKHPRFKTYPTGLLGYLRGPPLRPPNF